MKVCLILAFIVVQVIGGFKGGPGNSRVKPLSLEEQELVNQYDFAPNKTEAMLNAKKRHD